MPVINFGAARRICSTGRPQRRKATRAEVAQSVEHMTENHGVGGSIPPLGTSALSCDRLASGAFIY